MNKTNNQTLQTKIQNFGTEVVYTRFHYFHMMIFLATFSVFDTCLPVSMDLLFLLKASLVGNSVLFTGFGI